MSETQAPRVWIAGNPEPSDVRLRVRDKHGDIWKPEQVLGGVRVWSTPETALATWDYLAKKWGPLTEVIATSLGVSGEDRSEPTPAPREFRSPDDVPRFLASSLRTRSGSVYGRHYATNEVWWRRARDGEPADGHGFACDSPISLDALPAGEWPLSEVVSPEGTP